jgi:hypothetical protein
MRFSPDAYDFSPLDINQAEALMDDANLAVRGRWSCLIAGYIYSQ